MNANDRHSLVAIAHCPARLAQPSRFKAEEAIEAVRPDGMEQCLVPTLKRGDIVVADNVSFHKVAGVKAAIRGVGASLRYLPQYSPDLNPIQLVLHPAKTFLRKAAERTIEGLHRCVRSFIRTLDPSECSRYFKHAGYDPL